MQKEKFKIHFYKEGNVFNKDGKIRIGMKVRYQGQEVQRRVVGYLPPDSWKQGKVIGRSQECVEMRSIMDKAYQEYHEACAFVVNNLGQELTRTALNRRLGRANNHKDLRFSEAVDLYLEAHPAISYHSVKGYHNFKKRMLEFGDCSATRFSRSMHQEFETWLRKTRPNIGAHSLKHYCQVAPQAIINWMSSMDEFGQVVNIWAFGNGPRYSRKATNPNRNKALTLEQLEVYYSQLPQAPANPERDPDLFGQYLHLNLWFLQFSFGGMNLTNFLFLQKDDYDFITHTLKPQIRNKTGELIHSFTVFEKAWVLVEQIAAYSDNQFLFPIVSSSSKALRAHVVNNYQKKANASLRTYCEKIGIPAVTTYNSRSTFASIADQKGFLIEDIQRIMGHARLEQTKEYIRRLPKRISMEGLF